MLTLASDVARVVVDPSHGAEILAFEHRASGVDVLFRSPWRERAEAVCAGQRSSTVDPTVAWLEQYRGGWQTLFPNAGAPRSVHGAPVGYHGELSLIAWTVDSATPDFALMHAELFAVPVRVIRTLRLVGSALILTDRLENLSQMPLDLDYVQHPALGGSFLEQCVLDTGATTFTVDLEVASEFEPGSKHAWPLARTAQGEELDLRIVPPAGEQRELFGWLSDFSAHWLSARNPALGLGVRVEWDGNQLPYAWLWQELNHTERFPWYGRARALGLEPSSTQTSGPSRRPELRIEAGGFAEIPTTLALEVLSTNERSRLGE